MFANYVLIIVHSYENQSTLLSHRKGSECSPACYPKAYIFIYKSLFGVRRGSFKVTLPFFTSLKVFSHGKKELPTEFISELHITTTDNYFCELKVKTTFQKTHLLTLSSLSNV